MGFPACGNPDNTKVFGNGTGIRFLTRGVNYLWARVILSLASGERETSAEREPSSMEMSCMLSPTNGPRTLCRPKRQERSLEQDLRQPCGCASWQRPSGRDDLREDQPTPWGPCGCSDSWLDSWFRTRQELEANPAIALFTFQGRRSKVV